MITPVNEPIGRNISMLRTEHNVNPNCISRDDYVSNYWAE